jgi:hypothetical protein
MLDKTFSAMNQVFKVAQKEMDEIFKDIESAFNKKVNIKGKTKIKIGKGSTITINGAKAQLLNDVFVVTDDPDTLMCKNEKSKK